MGKLTLIGLTALMSCVGMALAYQGGWGGNMWGGNMWNQYPSMKGGVMPVMPVMGGKGGGVMYNSGGFNAVGQGGIMQFFFMIFFLMFMMQLFQGWGNNNKGGY